MLESLFLLALPLFNPNQNTSSVFIKNLQPGTYKIRLHANTPITKAVSDFGTCKNSWQDAICNININQDLQNTTVATFFLQKRQDNKYILDYCNSDEAIRPNPCVVKYPVEDTNTGTNQQNTNTKTIAKSEVKTKINNKRTGINLYIIYIFLFLIVFSWLYYIILNFKKNK